MVVLLAVALGAMACRGDKKPAEAKAKAPVAGEPRPEMEGAGFTPAPGAVAPELPPDPYREIRVDMVERTIASRGISDPRVLTAMTLAPRHEFVPPAKRSEAYDDNPLPIGFGLTISQPYIVAAMTEAARVKPGDKVLEIGTGSGYQAAVLALMGAKVYTIEIHDQLGARTAEVLKRTGFRDVQTKIGDGWYGWPDAAPFDAILVTCATPVIPDRLLQQLEEGGRMVAPIGDLDQKLDVIVKTRTGIERESLMPVRFGPMLGVVEDER